MKHIPVSSKIRKIADMIEEDTTPTDEQIKQRRKSLGLVSAPLPPEEKKDPKKAPKKVKEEKIEPTAKPKIKPSRKKPDSAKKLTDDSKGEYFKDYMKSYRSEGKVNETSGPKNKYVKKLK